MLAGLSEQLLPDGRHAGCERHLFLVDQRGERRAVSHLWPQGTPASRRSSAHCRAGPRHSRETSARPRAPCRRDQSPWCPRAPSHSCAARWSDDRTTRPWGCRSCPRCSTANSRSGRRDRAFHAIQRSIRTRVLRAAVRHGALTPEVATNLGHWAHGGGSSLHAEVLIEAENRPALERLLRYRARPGFASERLEERGDERSRYTLPKPITDGNTALTLRPLELLDRWRRAWCRAAAWACH